MDQSTTYLWIGRIMSAIAGLFLLFDAGAKIARIAPVIEAMTKLGYSEGSIRGIGILLLTCTVLYLVPQSSAVGAVLLTGYLGGAMAVQLRINEPLFSHILFPVYVAIFVWGGLALRFPKVIQMFFGN